MAISVEEMGRPIEPLNGSSGGLMRSEEHTSELQSQSNLVCRLLLEKKKQLRGGGARILPPPAIRTAAARTTGKMGKYRSPYHGERHNPTSMLLLGAAYSTHEITLPS